VTEQIKTKNVDKYFLNKKVLVLVLYVTYHNYAADRAVCYLLENGYLPKLQ